MRVSPDEVLIRSRSGTHSGARHARPQRGARRDREPRDLPVELAELLVEAGHAASTVYSERLVGAPDPDLARVCLDEERVLSGGSVGARLRML